MKFKHGTRRKAVEYEKDWVKRWKENKTFEKSVENRPSDNAYVFYDGPPFITGNPHHGTLLSSIVKDAVPRYWTMKGKRVERVWGWDTHGLPAENFVEKQLGIVDRRQIVAGKPTNSDGLAKIAKINKNSKVLFVCYANAARSHFAQGFYNKMTDTNNADSAGVSEDIDLNEAPTLLAIEEIFSKTNPNGAKTTDTMMEVGIDVSDHKRMKLTENDLINYDLVVNMTEKSQTPDWLQGDNVIRWDIPNPRGESQEKNRVIRDEVERRVKRLIDGEGAQTSLVLDKDGNPLPTISLEKYITKARESMVANAATWEDVVDRIGRWVDFKGAYKTMDKNFMESVWWAFKELYDKGKIYEGEKVLMYDTKFATPVSKNEVTMDNDAYQTVTDPSVFVKFKLRNDDSYLLAWTTTPWTLPANTAIGVSKDIDYIEVEVASGKNYDVKDFATKPTDDPIVSIAKTVLSKFDSIKYGYVDNNEIIHLGTDADFDQQEFTGYRLQSVEQVQKSNVGVCWDQSEYARYLLKEESVSVNNYAIVYYDHENNNYFNHTAAVFQSEGKYHWLEHSMADIAGIYEFDNLQDLALCLKSEFLAHNKDTIPKNYKESQLRLWEYEPLAPGSSPKEIFNQWEKGRNLDYLLADNERLILAKALVEKVLVDDKKQPLEYKVIRELKGVELIGLAYQPLLGVYQGENAHKVWEYPELSAEEGTGIVHLAPIYGEADFELAKANDIPRVHVLDDNGFYFPEVAEKLFELMPWVDATKPLEVWESNKDIAKGLKKAGKVWKIDYIQHEYPFNPRSKQRIMYRAIPSWFFDIQGSKSLMLEQNENINWFPEHLKHGRFAKNIEQAPDWNLSRDRFWATAMPVWKGDKGTVKVVGSYAELKELSGVELDDYHRPWVDDIEFDIDGEHFTRIDKVLDCWFESGSMPFAQLHYPFENKEKFEKNYPADFIVEYIPQVRAWFYYVHAVNTALFGEEAFKNVITTGTLAGNDGRKMSKSLGNYTDPNELMNKYSADSLRFLLMSSPILNGEDFNLQDKDVQDVARKLSMVWNMYDFFTMYAEVDGWEFDGESVDLLVSQPSPVSTASRPTSVGGRSLGESISSGTRERQLPSSYSRSAGNAEPSELDSPKSLATSLTNPLDIWIVSRLHQLNQQITENMDAYNLPDALAPILPFIDDASNWFVRRSRRRFWKSEDDGDKNDAYRTLHYVLLKLSVILAPFTPFLAEELYQNMGGGAESVHLLDWPTNYQVDRKVLDDMDRARELINVGLGLRMQKDENQESVKVRQPLSVFAYPGEKLGEFYEKIIADELNVKTIENAPVAAGYGASGLVEGLVTTPFEGGSVALVKLITPELKREGLMREVIRLVQSARKNARLNVDDRIILSLETDDEELGQAIKEHEDTILSEVLGVLGVTKENQSIVKVDGIELSINIKRS